MDFDPGPAEAFVSTNGLVDIFVAKYTTDGEFVWAFNIGSNDSMLADQGIALAADNLGSIYVTGLFQGSDVDFDPGPGSTNLSSHGSTDIFLAKYSVDGVLSYAFNIGGASSDIGIGLGVDGSGNPHLTGLISGTEVDFDPGPDTKLLSSVGEGDIFVAKYSGTVDLFFAFNIGSVQSEDGKDLVVDHVGNIYVTGRFQGENVDFDPGPEPLMLSSNGGNDVFVAKYNQRLNMDSGEVQVGALTARVITPDPASSRYEQTRKNPGTAATAPVRRPGAGAAMSAKATTTPQSC